ncbi:MAG: hypothetical protein DIU69_01305 [Bacillota bacterium]|nr:MAG: hypothetical protein DIU69_01305 [Bacillota bacterium]
MGTTMRTATGDLEVGRPGPVAAPPASGSGGVAERYINRYMLPRVALTFISLASLAGIYLTLRMQGAPVELVPLRWLQLAGLGVLGGGCLWWGLFVRVDDAEAAAVNRYATEAARRFLALARVVLPLSLLAGLPHLFWAGRQAVREGAWEFWLVAAATLLVAYASAGTLLWTRRREPRWAERRPVRATLVLVIAALAATGALDARLVFGQWLPALLLRPLHLVAFALWIGGAVWNLFVAIPSARATLAIPVVVAAARQLERFRAWVRVFLPLLVLTGLAQAVPYTGWDPVGALAFWPGRLILFKLGLIGGLVIIFITCPLWRACSPIRGMCDLQELTLMGTAATAVAAAPAAHRRLDSRGRSCAGFVHIQRELESMAPGEILELLSSDPISWWELPAWLELNGHVLEARERRGFWLWATYRYLIRKGGANREAGAAGVAAAEAGPGDHPREEVAAVGTGAR